MHPQTIPSDPTATAFAALDALCDVLDATRSEILPNSVIIAREAISVACNYRDSLAGPAILEDLANTLSDVASEARRARTIEMTDEPRRVFDTTGVRLSVSDGWSL